MSNHLPRLGVIFHIYFGLRNGLQPQLELIQSLNGDFDIKPLFTLAKSNPNWEDHAHELTNMFPNAEILLVANRGKDIGAKICGAAWFMENNQKIDHLLMVHDKHSPQVIDGEKWRRELFAMLTPANRKQLLTWVNNNPTNICCSESAIMKPDQASDDYMFGGATNKTQILQLARQFKLQPEELTFVAGTMFLCKSAPLFEFLGKHAPFEIWNNLETGNPLDIEGFSHTHAWERLLSWIFTSNRSGITGI